MKILLLEDEKAKAEAVIAEIHSLDRNIQIDESADFIDYLKKISKTTYDLIIVDLVIPRYPKQDSEDMTTEIIEETRNSDCCNYKTPVLALTGYNATAEERFEGLNSKDITVITFSPTNDSWKDSVISKIKTCTPPINYDFVIVCALPKERDGFIDAGYQVEERKTLSSLSVCEIKIGEKKGAIVVAPRMGLVSSAVTATQAIELFNPKLICMSGICGGFKGESKIYDVVIPENCHQHDAGKWTDTGFKPEINTVPLDHTFRIKLEALIEKQSFLNSIRNGITLRATEFPKGVAELELNIQMGASCSGSSVLAQTEMVEAINSQRRKMLTFEMESYAVYEAARLSSSKPKYFSAKAVVDDGTPSKGDKYHRIACVLSAKVVYEVINSGVWEEQ